MNNLFLQHEKVDYIMKNTPVFLSFENREDILFFRRLIETAQRKGFWWGILGES